MTSSSATSHETSEALIKPDLLLVVFIHGFKGSDDTFGTFPDRLKSLLSESIDSAVTECVVYPKYETQGDLAVAVEKFSNWLKDEVAKREGDETGKAKVVLCGHSMGGFVAADSIIRFAQNMPDTHSPFFPRIIACLSYDAAYLGLRDGICLVNVITKGVKAFISTRGVLLNGLNFARKVITAPPIDAIRNGEKKFGSLVEEGLSTFDFIENLWREEELKRRLSTVIGYKEILFRTFYTLVPSPKERRTLINLPSETELAGHFLEAPNDLAKSELGAHSSMFDADANNGYERLVLETLRLIGEAVTLARRVA